MLLYIRDSSGALNPSTAQLLISANTTQQYFQVATAALLVYDAAITIDKEVAFFWGSSPRKPVTIVYFLNRYVGIFASVAALFSNVYNANIATCNFAQWTRSLANWIIIILIDYILMIRVLALYSEERRLRIFLKTLLALEAVFKLGSAIYVTWVARPFILTIAEGVSMCSFSQNQTFVFGIIHWIAPLVYGVLLMCLALYKAVEFWKLSAGFKGFRLINVLIRDQAIYLLIVVTCCVLKLLTYKILVQDIFLAVLLLQVASPLFLCILGNRMLFNLKEAGERGVNGGTSYRMKTFSNMEFDMVERSGGSSSDERTV